MRGLLCLSVCTSSVLSAHSAHNVSVCVQVLSCLRTVRTMSSPAPPPTSTWLSDDVCDLLRSVLLDWLRSVSDSSSSSHLLSFLKPMSCICSLRRLRVSGDQTSGSGSSSGVVGAPPSCPFIHWARWRALPLLAPDLPSCRHLCSIRSSKCLWEVPRDLHSGIGVCRWKTTKHY